MSNVPSYNRHLLITRLRTYRWLSVADESRCEEWLRMSSISPDPSSLFCEIMYSHRNLVAWYSVLWHRATYRSSVPASIIDLNRNNFGGCCCWHQKLLYVASLEDIPTLVIGTYNVRPKHHVENRGMIVAVVTEKIDLDVTVSSILGDGCYKFSNSLTLHNHSGYLSCTKSTTW